MPGVIFHSAFFILQSALNSAYLRDLFHGRIFDKVLLHSKPPRSLMKNPMEVLKQKEQELLKVRTEIDALRIAARLLSDDTAAAPEPKIDLRQVIEMP